MNDWMRPEEMLAIQLRKTCDDNAIAADDTNRIVEKFEADLRTLQIETIKSMLAAHKT